MKLSTVLNAQIIDYNCAWQEDITNQQSSQAVTCFDVQDIIENCTPIYLRLNVHYFVDDNCDGEVQQELFQQEEVYKNTERMIQLLNNEIKHNQKQVQSNLTNAPCLPFRFVLTGVYTHCKSQAEGEYNIINLNREFGVDRSNTINFYVAHSPFGASGIGYSWEHTGGAVRFNPEIWWTIGNLYHELGHIFGLGHTFNSDDCDDTPRMTFAWDKNCNGIIEWNPDKNMNEQNITCWGQLFPGTQPGEPGYYDGNFNQIGDCDEAPPCSPSPCCKSENIDNNVMSYSSNKSAITPCQLAKILNFINNNKCDLIEKIGGCPPTKAFINQLPRDKADLYRCTECLIMEGSWDEESFELKIFEERNDAKILVYDSGNRIGIAGRFCYKTSNLYPGYEYLLKPNTEYIAELKTFNECSQDFYTYKFRTNEANCGTASFDEMDILNNPVNGNFSLNIRNQDETGIYIVRARNINTGISYTLSESLIVNHGNNLYHFDAYEIPTGVYRLFVQNEHKLAFCNFVKM